MSWPSRTDLKGPQIMKLKEYSYLGSTYQFEEGAAPKGAVPVGEKAKPAPKNKAKTPANKSAKPAKQAAPVVDEGIEAASDPSASE